MVIMVTDLLFVKLLHRTLITNPEQSSLRHIIVYLLQEQKKSLKAWAILLFLVAFLAMLVKFKNYIKACLSNFLGFAY